MTTQFKQLLRRWLSMDKIYGNTTTTPMNPDAFSQGQNKISLEKGTGKDSLIQPDCNAICDKNVAIGLETTAGICGYKINSIYIYADYAFLDIGDGINHYEIGDIVNLDIAKHWYNRYKIAEKLKNYIIVDGEEPFAGIVIEAIYPDLYPVSEANLSLGDDETDNWIWVEGKNVGQPIDQYVGAFASGIKSISAGYGAFSGGRDTKAIGNYSTAFGRQTTADYASMAVGLRTHALGQQSFAGGTDTKTLGTSSFAFGGNGTTASGKFSFAVGTGAKANGTYSAAFGNQTIANNDNQFVVGLFNKPLEYPALFVVGDGSGDDARSNAFVVNANGTAQLGQQSVATNNYVESRISSARSYTDNKCSAIDSKWTKFTLQCDTKLGSIHQIGGTSTSPNPNNANVAGAIALGTGNTASGQYAVVLGENSTASGKYSFSAGTGNTASGADSVALGMGNAASMQHSLAQGWKSNATQPCAVAINCATTADGENSFTQGQRTKTTGKCAVAFNYYTQSNGANSSAFGNQTRTGYENQFVVGKFNNNKSDTMFEVGSGASDTDRANCFETGKATDGTNFIRVGDTEVTETRLKELLALNSSASNNNTLSVEKIQVKINGKEMTCYKQGNVINIRGAFNITISPNTTDFITIGLERYGEWYEPLDENPDGWYPWAFTKGAAHPDIITGVITYHTDKMYNEPFIMMNPDGSSYYAVTLPTVTEQTTATVYINHTWIVD